MKIRIEHISTQYLIKDPKIHITFMSTSMSTNQQKLQQTSAIYSPKYAASLPLPLPLPVLPPLVVGALPPLVAVVAFALHMKEEKFVSKLVDGK
jgi:hypothetical protein